MRFLSLFVAGLMCCLSGTAMSQTAIPSSGGATNSLPNVVVEAPKQVARPQRPKQRAVARNAVSSRTSQSTQTPSAPESVSAKLAKLASATGSCVGGCVTSFRYADAPWHGMLRVWLASVVANVQKRRQLQNLRRVHGGRTDNRLERQ